MAYTIRRETKQALEEWLAHAEDMHKAVYKFGLKGDRFVEFAEEGGVKRRQTAYDLVKLHEFREQIMERCEKEEASALTTGDEFRWPAWKTALAWFYTPKSGQKGKSTSQSDQAGSLQQELVQSRAKIAELENKLTEVHQAARPAEIGVFQQLRGSMPVMNGHPLRFCLTSSMAISILMSMLQQLHRTQSARHSLRRRRMV